ncbi:MAG: protein phosphatase 2C domain-containing protein [Anaerolineae bacterium]
MNQQEWVAEWGKIVPTVLPFCICMKQIENNAVADLLISFGTHAGMVGKNNEDFVAFAAFDSGVEDVESPVIFHLGIVADGVGGQTAGERASRLATNTIVSYFANLESLTIEQVSVNLDKAITLANTTVIQEAKEVAELKGMATTIAVVAILEGLIFTAHVGDSRIYLFRDNTLHQITNDHSWVQEALEAGIINNDEARSHPNRNIIRRSLGTVDNVTVDQVMMSGQNSHFWQGMPLRKEDTVLICSDGLTDMISDFDVQLSLEEHTDQMSDLVVELIDKANHAGGKDNTTVMIVKTADNFSPNRMMPIAPSLKPIVHRSVSGPEPEKLTLIGKSIDRNTVAPPTIRSMPTITPNMIRTYKDNGRTRMAIAGDMPTVKSSKGIPKDKRPTMKTHARASSLPLEDAPKPEETTVEDASVADNTFQQFMIRFVIGLAVVAGSLTVLVFILSWLLS